MQKIFTNILLGILLILVALFAYKILRKPEIVQTSLNNTQTDEEKVDQRVLNEPKLSEEELNIKIHDYILNHLEEPLPSIKELVFDLIIATQINWQVLKTERKSSKTFN